MGILELIPQLFALGMQIVSGIQARRQARQNFDQGQLIRAALEQTNKNSEIYQQIVAEANAQIAEQDAKLASQIKAAESLLAQAKPSARVSGTKTKAAFAKPEAEMLATMQSLIAQLKVEATR